MNILEQFWNGEICPAEQFIPNDSEYFAVIRKFGEEKQKLLTVCSPEQQAEMERLQMIATEAVAIAERDAFTMGFRLAVQMMVESL